MTQILLFRDPTPLVDRLGLDFFRQLPERPGVYLMRDASDVPLYIGKAKNLRQRLAHYRVANPDRMPRRHLRLLRTVARIEVQECRNEESALDREAQLLRTLKPRFNRVGTWPGPPLFVAWKWNETEIHLTVAESPGTEWRTRGRSSGAGARHERAVLARLLWFALFPARGIAGMPAGWFRGRFGDVVTFDFQDAAAEAREYLESVFAGQPDSFAQWILGKSPDTLPLFEKTMIDADLEFLMERFSHE